MALPEIDRGATYRFTYTHKHNGVAADLTGATVALVIKEENDDSVGDATAIMKKVVTSHSNPSLGQTVISFLPAETLTSVSTSALIEEGTYAYTIKIKHADGSQFIEDEGKVKVDASATNVVL